MRPHASAYSAFSRAHSSAIVGTSAIEPTPWPADQTCFQARLLARLAVHVHVRLGRQVVGIEAGRRSGSGA